MYNSASQGYGSGNSNTAPSYASAKSSSAGEGYSFVSALRELPVCLYGPHNSGGPSEIYLDPLAAKRNYTASPEVRHQQVHTSLLAGDRPKTQFVGDASIVREWVEDAFEKVVGEPFPKNIRIVVGSEDEIRASHSGNWSSGILGFSLNRQGFGLNEIYIKQNNLDVLMLTIGHEIGHVMSPSLPSIHDEEAKAFAFELAWIEMIIKNNIAGLEECFIPAPAKNGLHDSAFSFVRHLIDSGKDAISVFADLVWGKVSMTETLEWRVSDNG